MTRDRRLHTAILPPHQAVKYSGCNGHCQIDRRSMMQYTEHNGYNEYADELQHTTATKPGRAAQKSRVDKAAKHYFLCHRRDKDRPEKQRRADMPCDGHRRPEQIRIENQEQSRT